MGTLTTGELAAKLGAVLEGDGAAVVSGVADLQTARAGQVSFATKPRYLSAVAGSAAAAVIVPQDAAIAAPKPALLRVAKRLTRIGLHGDTEPSPERLDERCDFHGALLSLYSNST